MHEVTHFTGAVFFLSTLTSAVSSSHADPKGKPWFFWPGVRSDLARCVRSTHFNMRP